MTALFQEEHSKLVCNRDDIISRSGGHVHFLGNLAAFNVVAVNSATLLVGMAHEDALAIGIEVDRRCEPRNSRAEALNFFNSLLVDIDDYKLPFVIVVVIRIFKVSEEA